MSISQNTPLIFGTNSGADASVFEVLHPDLLGLVRSRLQQAAATPDLFTQVFGDKANTVELQTVRSQWSVGDFTNLPSVQILSTANAREALGAYVSSTQTVYLSDVLLQSNAPPSNSFLGAVGVLIEETFHWLDDRTGTDTAGDEGELARNLVFGESLSASELTRIRGEDDTGFITINGQQTSAELNIDYAGNTSTTGFVSIGGSSIAGTINFGGDKDWFRVNLVQGVTYDFRQNRGTLGDSYLTLFDSSSVARASNDDGGGNLNSLIRYTATYTGSHYLQAGAYSSSDFGTYTVSAVEVDDYASNTATTGLVNIGGSTAGRINFGGDTDWFRVNLLAGTTYQFRQNASTLIDPLLTLRNSVGGIITSNDDGGGLNNSLITYTATSTGTYFLSAGAYSSGDYGSYSVSANALDDYAGNTSTTGFVSIGGSATGRVEVGGDTDWFRVNLVQGTAYQFRQNRTTLGDPYLTLFDSSSVARASNDDGGGSFNSLITYTATYTGSHYLQARAYSSSDVGNYTVGATLFAPPTILDGAGNTLGTARNIGTLFGTQRFGDWVGTEDTNDFYRFSLNAQSSFSLTLNGLSADADVQLIQDLNNNGIVDGNEVLQGSYNSGTTADAISRTLNAGNYFVRVYPYTSVNNISYNLSLTANPILPIDRAGNTLGAARNIGTLVGTQAFTDWVGNGDTNDFYRFTLGTQSNLSLTLSGLSSDADVQLIQDINNNGIVDASEVLQGSYRSGTTADTISRTLNAGTYFARVYQYSGNTYYNLALTATAPTPTPTPGDWYSQNLRDAGIISLTRSLAADGSLSRNDILSVFRNAQDGSVVDANEVIDLRTIVSNSARFALSNSVRYLSTQVANGAFANISASQFESNLVGRWFLGTVTPTAVFNEDGGSTYNFTHTAVQGSLFGSTGQARIGDIDQGSFGDCAFLAALGATFRAQSNDAGNQSSSVINSMIENNGVDSVTGIQSYTFRFYSNGSAEYVTVDNRLATYNGNLFGARNNGALWAPLAERAYAQWLEWRGGTPGYNRIGNGDNLVNPLSFITGRSVDNYNASSVTFTFLQSALSSGRAVETARVGSYDTALIVDGHAYSVTNAYVNSIGQQRVVVRNPWGVDGRTASGDGNDGFIDLSFAEFRSTFNFGVAFA